MNTHTGYVCPFSDCRESVPVPDDDGLSFCERCGEQVEPEKVIEFDRDDIAYEKARNTGWED
jgi:hypothetical protein